MIISLIKYTSSLKIATKVLIFKEKYISGAISEVEFEKFEAKSKDFRNKRGIFAANKRKLDYKLLLKENTKWL